MEISKIYDILYRLGLTADSSAFFYTSFAVFLALENPGRLYAPGWLLYPKIACQYKTTVSEVTAGIRDLINDCWAYRPSLMYSVIGYRFPVCPSVPTFIFCITEQLRNN